MQCECIQSRNNLFLHFIELQLIWFCRCFPQERILLGVEQLPLRFFLEFLVFKLDFLVLSLKFLNRSGKAMVRGWLVMIFLFKYEIRLSGKERSKGDTSGIESYCGRLLARTASIRLPLSSALQICWKFPRFPLLKFGRKCSRIDFATDNLYLSSGRGCRQTFSGGTCKWSRLSRTRISGQQWTRKAILRWKETLTM